MKKRLLISLLSTLLFLIGGNSFGQFSLTNTSSTVPLSMDVCGGTATFTYTIENVSAFTIVSSEILLNLPAGLNYIPGSVSGATENNISNLNQPILSTVDLPSNGGPLVISFDAEVGCDAIAFLQGGGAYECSYVHSYNYGGGQSNSETTLTQSFNIDYPFIIITNVTNQSYSGNVGDTYQQCVTITNSGQSALDHLWFNNQHGVDLSTSNYTPGSVVNSGAGYDSVYVSGTDFNSFGNGNNLFDPGETVTICYDVTINGCDFVSSDLSSFWGCNNQFCQVTSSTSNAFFPNLIPNLDFTITQNTYDGCLGNADSYEITIENIGSGAAYNVLLDIFNHANGNQTNAYLGYLVPGSFNYSLNGAPQQPLDTTTLNTNNVIGCVPANSPSEVESLLPVLNPGDIIVISFEQYLCCPDFCASQHRIPGIGMTATYENVCGFSYTEPFIQINNYKRIQAVIFNDGSPSTLVESQASIINFGVNPAANNLPTGPGAQWMAEFTLPPCSSWDGLAYFTESNGNIVLPDSTTNVGQVITAYFAMPLNINQGQFNVGIIPDCDPACMSGGGGADPCQGVGSGSSPNPPAVTMHLYYIPDVTCGCLVDLCELTIEMTINCPSLSTGSPAGFACSDFSFDRTSYGLPDNNDDGVADPGPAVLDMNLIRTDRCTYGDTVTGSSYGIVDTIGGAVSYDYFIVDVTVEEGTNLTEVSSVLNCFDVSSGTLFSENIPAPTVSIAAPFKNFNYIIDVNDFVNAPPGFVFEDGDTVWVETKYRVTSNPGGNIVPMEAENTFFMTNDTTAIDTSLQCLCSDIINLYGYYFTIWGPNTDFVSECDSVKFTENFYLSIGPCCSNYAGGNAFRYEYRNFATLDTMEIVLPAGYYYSSARIRQRHGTGLGTSAWSNWEAIAPSAVIPSVYGTQIGGQHYKFATDYLYTNGNFIYPDEGFYGTFEFYADPSCEVAQDVEQWIGYIADFDTDTLWFDSQTSSSPTDITRDKITYNGADLFIQSSLPSIQTQTNTATWTVTIANVSNVVGSNIFLALDNTSGNLVVNSIYDVISGTTIPNNGGNIFPIGDIPVATQWEFIITADVDACGLDSIVVYAGWNCTGTPPDLLSYPCLNQSPFITLSVLPLEPFLTTQVLSSVDSIGLCDVSQITMIGENIQLGWAYDMDLTLTLPTGALVVPGSVVACYPAGSGNCFNIPDPVSIGGSQFLWDSLIFNGVIGITGMPGFDSTVNSIEVTFDLTTDCSYTSGSYLTAGYQAYAGCGDMTGEEVAGSPPIFIENSVVPFDAQIFLQSQSLSPCEDSTALEVWVTNYGPVDFGPMDSVTVILPDGFYYVPGTTAGINMGPTNLNPTISTFGTLTYLSWPIPPISPGDSTHFVMYYQGDPAFLDCQALEIEAYSTTVNNLLCVNGGSSCSFNTIATDTSTFVFIYKGFLELVGGSGTAVGGPGPNETIDLSFDINNFGNTIGPNFGTTVNYYTDSNFDGLLDAGDVLLTSNVYNILLDSNTTTNLQETLLVPSGLGCQLIVEINSIDNICSCLSDTLVIVPEYQLSVQDTSTCTDVPVQIGDPQVSNYFNYWIPQDPQYVGVLNSVLNAQPTATYTTGATTNPDTIVFTYITYRDDAFFPFHAQCLVFDTLTLLVYPEPIVDAGLDTTICNYDDLTLDGSIVTFADSTYWTQISGPSVVSISDVSDTNAVLSGFVAGVYEFELTGSSIQCNDGTDTMQITVIDPLLSEISHLDVSCYNFADGEIEIDASNGVGPYTYSVDGGVFGNTVLYSNLDTAQYTFVVMDALGCLDTLIANITEPDTLTIDFDSTNVTCSYSFDGTITALVAGGTTAYNYAWSDGQITQTAVGLDSGAFVVTVTDANGCVSVDSTDIMLLYPDPIVDAGNDTTLCYYDFVTLDGSVLVYSDSIYWTQISGPTTLTFADVNDTNTTVTGFIGGTYELVLTGSNFACTDGLDTMVITAVQPVLSELGLTNVSCFNFADGTIDIGAANGIAPYLYNVNGGLFGGTVNYTNLDTGSYEFIVQDDLGCFDTLTSVITQPDSLTIVLTPFDVSCSGLTDGSIESVVDGGTTGYNYAWSDGQTTAIATNLDSGTYVLTVTDANGCITVETAAITTPPALSVTAVVDSVSCYATYDGSIDITAVGGTAPLNYLWNGTDVIEDLIGYGNGTYYLEITDANNCVLLDTFDIYQPLQIAITSVVTDELCDDDCSGIIDISSISGGTGSYTTYFQATNVGATTQFTDLCDGAYSIDIEDQNGCQETFDFTILPGTPFPDAAFDVLQLMCAYDNDVVINPVVSIGDWTIDGVPSTTTFNPSTLGAGTFTIEHIIPGSCPDTFNLDIVVNGLPTPVIWADELVVCIPEDISLNNLGSAGVNCEWDINGWISNDCGPISFASGSQGYYDVSLTVTDANGCVANQTITDYLYFSDSPDASFYASPWETSFYDPLIDLINTSSGATSYEWFVEGDAYSTETNTSYSHSLGPAVFNIELVATNDAGCTDTARNYIEYLDEPSLFVPNVFTPDGNSINNEFQLVGMNITIVDWYVFNRWGEVIFHGESLTDTWDGTYEGILVQDGVYVYKVIYLEDNSELPIEKIGHVTLLR